MERKHHQEELSSEIKISYEDATKIWRVLDNLRVSLDGIFGHYSEDKRLLFKELEAYLTSGIWKDISDAAFSLYRYIPEEPI